jgi:hypothetical protein
VFPQIYADCASGINDQGTDLAVGFYGANALLPPGVTPKIDTCAYLIHLGVDQHAAVPGWRHWRYVLAADVPPPVTTIDAMARG